ncbi:MAG: hypothetical protein LBI18_15145 [Planctomycetaceae bacterium]|jgi:hypothetical protein|nr:hypothetical protein [Planctomycetaceae bacterium]
MKIQIYFCLLMICVISLLGCQKRVYIYGKVTYPDGTLLKKGTVCFQSEQLLAQGDIQANGNYRLGMNKSGDGVVPGSYTIYVSGALDIEEVPLRQSERDPIVDPKKTPLIHPKFMSPQTSGLNCNVEKGMKLPYNITVEYP